MGRLIDEDSVLKVVEHFTGYLDEDMITRIKIAIKKDVPDAAEVVTGVSTSNVTNELFRIYPEAKDKVKSEVLQSIASQMYSRGDITIKEISDPWRGITAFTGQVLVVHRIEGDEDG